MIRSGPSLPAGHGELLVRPAYESWGELARENAEAAKAWEFRVGDLTAGQMRSLARSDALDAAQRFSARLGVEVRTLGEPSAPIVMTGHQPELYHPGVWVKDFLLQRLGRELDASAIDIVVDTDGFDAVSIVAPCLTPEVRRCRQYLAIGSRSSCYACAPAPSTGDIEDFCRIGDEMLATLPAPSIRRHFSEFCGHLRGVEDARGLAEAVTFARRRYEASAGSDYAELPVTNLVRGEGFSAFVADLALDAERFASAYNGALEEYRAANGTRSAAQPFPDLEVDGSRTELPLWALGAGRREVVWAVRTDEGVDLVARSQVLATLPPDPALAREAVRRASTLFAPKALALTLFVRMFCCDLFIHGVGGGRYDRVTDGVCQRFYGVAPPRFVVASLTMYLPLGGHLVTDEEVARAKERLNRLDHNPNELLGEVEFDTEQERDLARSLAAEKAELVAAIGATGADKKALGMRIKEVNTRLAALLAPLRAEYEQALSSLETQRAVAEVLTDRSYPFCFWAPEEIADKIR